MAGRAGRMNSLNPLKNFFRRKALSFMNMTNKVLFIVINPQHGRSLIYPNGSHCSMWDDLSNYFPGLIRFIKDVDGGGFTK